MKYVGRSVPSLTNRVLAAGKGTFVADLELPNVAHLAILRSDHGHARIRSIDTRAAAAEPGVLCVLTGADVRKAMKPVPWASDPASIGGHTVDVYPLAADRVRYAGEPVVAVVAEDRYVASEALRRVEVDYEPLPAVTDAVAGLDDRGPLVEPAWGTNVLLRKTFTRGDVATALAAADGVVEGTVKTHRYAAVPLEPRAYAASYEPFTRKLTVWSSTQNPHPLRGFIAEALGMPDTDVRVIQPNVGGGFGEKVPPFPEEILVAHLSRRLERPIRWVEERTEHLAAGGHAREETLAFTAGYRKDGTVVALRARVVADVGAPTGLCGWAMSFVSAFCIPGPYRIDDCEVELYSVVTNKCPWNGYRAFGKEAAAYLMDRVMDKVAAATGRDRAEVRLRNFLPPSAFPFEQVSGAVLDSGDYARVLRDVLERIDYAGFPERQAEARRAGKLLGLGIGFELTPEGGAVPRSRVIQGYDGTSVRMSPEGRVTVLTGVTSPGSGNETAIAQIVADELGVELDAVQVVQGDTDVCPYGLGNYSSRSIMMGGSAAALAAADLRKKLLAVAAKMLEVSAEDLEAEGGRIRLRGAPQRFVPIRDVAGEIYRHTYGPAAEDVEPGLESTRYSRIGNLHHQPERQNGHFSMYPTWPYAACGLEVEVDPDTGYVKLRRCVFVHDCGTVVNPGLVDANVHGGLAQGLGGVMFERLVYDDAGQFLTATLMDYTLPTADDLVKFEVAHRCTPSPFTALGTKGAGESGVGAPLGAMVQAVENALADRGVVIDETPVTPDRVWKAIHRKDGTAKEGQ
ncbi:MAG TPA: xanthine dehydrogenase family protein molybdopterin-binding subunit [Candidatus Binatia bacterium]|nr:xanthine dehydrogenase family protein molybdopterin-binding subunit [Candidatus Binatia bacterium]